MSQKSKSTRGFPKEFREKAVRLVNDCGQSIEDVAKHLGCSAESIRRWKEAATAKLDPETAPMNRSSRANAINSVAITFKKRSRIFGISISTMHQNPCNSRWHENPFSRHRINLKAHVQMPRERFLKRGGIALAFSVEFLQNPFLA